LAHCDYQEIYDRKKEFTPERLRSLDEKILDALAYCQIDHLKVNVTDNSFNDVVDIIVRQVSARV